MYFYLVLYTIFQAIPWVYAQSVTPFIIDGQFGTASATDATKFNSGGNIVVAGLPITVPENLLVQFPATFVGFRDFAANAGQYGGFEVNVEGNYVDGKAIAGRVSISQLLGGIGGGLISAVNLDGTINIAGGPTLRINTPGGVYGPVYDKNRFFTSDEQNPSVSSFSGYPMCVPRSASDPDCPSTNRAPNGDRVYTPRNTSAMAPFIPGDYVTWSGITNGGEILVYTLTAENVQQKTSADNGDPLYLRVEDVIIAINDGTPNIEVGTTKFTGYLSDGTGSVSVYRLDVDPCTGAETEVQVAAGQLKAGDVRNKFDIRFSDTGITKLAREYRIKANKGAKTVAFGIQAGQYTAPISAVIWPENNVPGTTITQNAFNLFGQLKDGFVFNNQQWGQLANKWPGAPIPTTAKQCTGNELNNTPSPSPAPSTNVAPPSTAGELPIANAGQPLTNQLAGSLITIAGSNTNAKLTDPQLTFSWTGPTGITINNADKPTMTFVNPMLNPTTSPTTNKFTLKICLASDATACNSATVDVTTNTVVDKITITSYQFANKNGGTVTVSAKSDNILKGTDGANLQLQITPAVNKQIPAMTPDPVTPGLYSIVVPGVGKQPTQIGVTSKYNTKAVTASTLFRRSWVRF